MKLLYTIAFSAFLMAGGFLSSCQDDIENYDNSVYLGSTDRVENILVDIDEATKSAEVVTYLAKPESGDVTVTYAVNADLVNRYNGLYADNAELLPADFYEIPDPVVTIKAGDVAAAGLDVTFKNLTALDLSKVYVLPLSIQSSTVNVLESQRTVYYVIKKAALVNWAGSLSNNNVYVDWKNPGVVNNLSQLTAEALVYIESFADGRGSNISTIMGIEGKFLIRLGDATIPNDQLQVAADNNDNVTASDWKLKAKTWNHIAVTYDKATKKVQLYINGKKKSEQTFAKFGGDVNWGIPHSDEAEGKPRCFWIGYSYDKSRYFDGNIAECRIWNRVLSEEEIKAENHFYRVAEDASGLVAYWKFADGSGNSVKDYTSNGNTATASNSLTWVSVKLPE